MTTADSNGLDPNTPDAAPGAEPTIPKWRLDEVLGKLRAREEELAMKDQLLNQVRGPAQAEPEESETFGLEPETAKAITKLATKIAEKKLREAGGRISNQLATVANSNEELRFLQMYGNDKASYLAKITEQRKRHFAMTQSYQSVEDAYKIVKFDELNRATQPTKKVEAASAGTVDTTPPSLPDSRQTAAAPGGVPPKAQNEMTLEEREALLDRQMADSGLFI